VKNVIVCPSCSACLELDSSFTVRPVPAASVAGPEPGRRSVARPAGPFKRAVQEARPQPAAPAGYVCSSCGQPAVAVRLTCRKGENASRSYQGMQCQTAGCPSSGGRMLSGTFRWLSEAA